MKNRINPIIALLSITCFVLLCALTTGPQRQASAQTSGDTKVIAGSAGHLVSCTKTLPVFTTALGDNLDLFSTSGNTFGVNDHCYSVWNLVKDHPSGGPASVYVHFFKRATSANYGHIDCRVTMVEHGTSDDPPEDIASGWTTTTDNPSNPNGLPLTMLLALPGLVNYPDGHQALWTNSAESVQCNFGNDYVVTDIEYTESGAD